ncbi:MAG: hypothetical protein HOM55_00180 [Proteobacteria bacterium]|jgi:hypothetical protein|nr:hypothetical protein [Pseudomonadota bacterium]
MKFRELFLILALSSAFFVLPQSAGAANFSLGCFHQGSFIECPPGVAIGSTSANFSGTGINWTTPNNGGTVFVEGTGPFPACPTPLPPNVNLPDVGTMTPSEPVPTNPEPSQSTPPPAVVIIIPGQLPSLFPPAANSFVPVSTLDLYRLKISSGTTASTCANGYGSMAGDSIYSPWQPRLGCGYSPAPTETENPYGFSLALNLSFDLPEDERPLIDATPRVLIAVDTPDLGIALQSTIDNLVPGTEGLDDSEYTARVLGALLDDGGAFGINDAIAFKWLEGVGIRAVDDPGVGSILDQITQPVGSIMDQITQPGNGPQTADGFNPSVGFDVDEDPADYPAGSLLSNPEFQEDILRRIQAWANFDNIGDVEEGIDLLIPFVEHSKYADVDLNLDLGYGAPLFGVTAEYETQEQTTGNNGTPAGSEPLNLDADLQYSDDDIVIPDFWNRHIDRFSSIDTTTTDEDVASQVPEQPVFAVTAPQELTDDQLEYVLFNVLTEAQAYTLLELADEHGMEYSLKALREFATAFYAHPDVWALMMQVLSVDMFVTMLPAMSDSILDILDQAIESEFKNIDAEIGAEFDRILAENEAFGENAEWLKQQQQLAIMRPFLLAPIIVRGLAGQSIYMDKLALFLYSSTNQPDFFRVVATIGVIEVLINTATQGLLVDPDADFNEGDVHSVIREVQGNIPLVNRTAPSDVSTQVVMY